MTLEYIAGVNPDLLVQEERKGREISGGELFATGTRLLSPFEQKVASAMFRNVSAQWTTYVESTRGHGGTEDNSLKLIGHKNVEENLKLHLDQNRDSKPIGIATLSSMMFESSHRGIASHSALKPFEIIHSLKTMATGNCLETFVSGRTNCLEQMASVVVLSRLYESLLDIKDAVIIPYTTKSMGTGNSTKLVHDHFGIKVTGSDGSEWLMMNSGVYVELNAVRDESGRIDPKKIERYISGQMNEGKESKPMSQQVSGLGTYADSSLIESNVRGLTAHMLNIYRAQKTMLDNKNDES